MWAVIVMAVSAVGLAVGLAFGIGRGEVTPSARDAAVEAESAERLTTEAPSIVFVGDSWTYGVGATDDEGYAQRLVTSLRWENALRGVGGSGYTVTGGAEAGDSASTYGERAEQMRGGQADVVVVQGSLNDRDSSAQTITEGAVRTFTALREGLPTDAEILVVGSTYTPGTTVAEIDKVNSAVGAAALQAGLRFIDPAAEGWLNPDDPALWADDNHPSDAGHQVFADRLLPIIQETRAAAQAG